MADDDSIWVRTMPDLNGTYRVTLEIDADTSHPLDSADVMIYARAILAAVARAEHDAAVVRQMTKVCGDRQTAVELVGSIRADRPPISWPTPLELDPGVSVATGEAFLRILVRGKTVGQWTAEDARSHAVGVLEAVEAADLDGAYLRALKTIGLDEPRARAAVGDLGNYRVDV